MAGFTFVAKVLELLSKTIVADTIAQFNTALNNTATYDESAGYLVYIFTS
jgi:hypothetical protein